MAKKDKVNKGSDKIQYESSKIVLVATGLVLADPSDLIV